MSRNIDRQGLIDAEESIDQEGFDSPPVCEVITNSASLAINSANHSSEEPIVYTSQLAALLIIINVTIGAGVLAMPSKMQEAGVIPALILQIPFLAAIIVTTIMCTEMTVKTKVNSYHTMVEKHANRYYYIVTQVALLFIVFGTIAAFIVIIGDQSDSLFYSLYKEKYCDHPWYMNRNLIVTIATLFLIIPLCSAKTVDFLKYASFLGVLSIGFIVYMVLEQSYEQYTANINLNKWYADNINWWPKKWTSAPLILPVYCIAFQCHLSWVPTAATTRREEKYLSYKTISAAMIIASIIYSSVCILALLACGDKIQPDLTASFGERKNWIVEGTILIVAFKCIFTLPAAFLPARISIIEFFEAKSPKFAALKEPVRRCGVTAGVILLALTTALISKKIQVVVEILGCLSVLFIFPLPAICYLKSVDDNRRYKQLMDGDETDVLKYTFKDKAKRYLSFFFIAFGFLMLFLVLYTSIDDIVSSQNNSDDPCKSTNSTSMLQHHSFIIG